MVAKVDFDDFVVSRSPALLRTPTGLAWSRVYVPAFAG